MDGMEDSMSQSEKSKRSLTDKKNVADDTLLPKVLLHDIGSHNEPKDDSAQKSYVENLEQEVEDSQNKIDELESYVNCLEAENEQLKKKVRYLKAVWANQKAIAQLLKNIPKVSKATVSSLLSRKRTANVDSCSAYPAKKPFGKSTGSVSDDET